MKCCFEIYNMRLTDVLHFLQTTVILIKQDNTSTSATSTKLYKRILGITGVKIQLQSKLFLSKWRKLSELFESG